MYIHQVLYGYKNGHNLLASSYHLPNRDDDLMKMLSDWSEYAGGTDGDSSYITAYLLSESGLYAVSKTWYAEEKERPGCVWTHTLLLDINNIDTSFDFRSLISLFRRPVDGEYESYGEPILFSNSDTGNKLEIRESSDLVCLMYLYVQLLQPSDTMFVVERTSEYYQLLCLTLMQHLPVSILKQCSFSSGSDAGRLIYGRPFSLQFTSRKGMRLSNSKELASLKVTNFDSGVVAICSSIAEGKQDISQFVRLFDVDINGDVAKLCAIGKLYAFMDKSQTSDGESGTIEDVVQVIVEAFPNIDEGRKVKTAFLGKNVSNLFSNEEYVLFVLGTTSSYNSIDYSSIGYQQRIDDLALAQDRKPYFSLLSRLSSSETLNVYGQSVIKDSANRLSFQDQTMLMTEYWNTYLSLLSVCPKMLENGEWVDFDDERFVPVYELFSKDTFQKFAAWDKLFLRVLYQHRNITGTVWSGFLLNVRTIVEDTMDYLNDTASLELDERLCNYVSDNIGRLSFYLGTKTSISVGIKQFVFTMINPGNSLIAATDSATWWVISDSVNLKSLAECVFLFILSYNWKDKTSLQYLKKAYYPIYKSLLSSKLEWPLWNKIKDYTENLYPWQEWDKCKKLRVGLVNYLRSSGYDKDVLKTFTPETELNEELMKLWK